MVLARLVSADDSPVPTGVLQDYRFASTLPHTPGLSFFLLCWLQIFHPPSISRVLGLQTPAVMQIHVDTFNNNNNQTNKPGPIVISQGRLEC